ncbi:hypothetical protein CROQUDRAFT_265185 [Cronartium quercuum f. sp. fusiforme G11]|uniref:Uncharacterized protein n=1 Tax=Cronartium quercuum f. sp. fusiforme G11 TaxID=708437 RepID=A0A9P6NTN3_9BASI|nr:hypothetical protein CROQUDRAFT_265185 [Cronartium quercuum f. sp. fusiforme G11]
MSRYVLDYKSGEWRTYNPFIRLKILYIMKNLLDKTRLQRSKVQQFFRKHLHPPPSILEERPPKRIRLLPNKKSYTFKKPQDQPLKPVGPGVALQPNFPVDTRRPLGKEDLVFAKADYLAQNSIKVHDIVPTSRVQLVETHEKKKVIKLKPGLRRHNRVAGGKGVSIAPPNGIALPLSTVMKKWYPMRRLGGFHWSGVRESKLGKAKFKKFKKFQRFQRFQKSTYGGILSNDIKEKALRELEALKGSNGADVAIASSQRRLPAVEMPVIINRMKRSRAPHNPYLIRMLETKQSLEYTAGIFTRFFGPQILKWLEEEPIQQIQVVNVLYWMAYSGVKRAYQALRTKLAAGGLEKSVASRTSRALNLLDEREALRDSIVSDFAYTGPPVSAKEPEVQDGLKQRLRDFTLSQAFAQVSDGARDLTTQALYRLFVFAIGPIRRDAHLGWLEAMRQLRGERKVGVQARRRILPP